MPGFIFHDPSGRRARNVRIFSGLAAAFVLALFAAFAANLAIAPHVPEVRFRDPHTLKALNIKVPRHESSWTRLPKAPKTRGSSPRPLTVGFYVSWDDQSSQSLSEHLNDLDVVAPQLILINSGDGKVTVSADLRFDNALRHAKKAPAVMPVVHNAEDGAWQGKPVEALLRSPASRKALIANLEQLADTRGYSGYVLDLENLSPEALALYPNLVAEMNRAFQSSGREIWVTVSVDDEGWPLKRLQDASDAIVPMMYDQHWQSDKPGPTASQDWFQGKLVHELRGLDPNKIILALGAYGYDWTEGQSRAVAITFHEAMQAAHDAGVAVTFDRASLNPTFRYKDDKGFAHEVWFLDAATLYNQIRVADAWRPRGYALWRLGSEDPGDWTLLGRGYDTSSIANLPTMPASQDIDYNGDGEVMNVSERPTPGARRLTLDKPTGLITNEMVDVFPTAWVVQRLGRSPGKVALTFDDGPDPRWTPKILDILKQKNAKATFFVIGRNMEDYPELVTREVAEGHLVGSHTYTHPNLADEPESAVPLEFNLTQRLFQTVTGRSLRFFRPPYLGDASPSTAAELKPLLTAQKLGYVTVGLRIDPDDWNRPDATLIVSRTLARLADTNPETSGQVVLLHDSGGNRSRTIMALPGLIDALRAKGYELVSVADLINMPPSQAMPAADEDAMQLLLDRTVFATVRGFDKGVAALFLSAIAIGLARLLFLAILAVYHRLRIDARTPDDIAPELGPFVSVLIPCYNEEAVIVSSVRQVLQSTWTQMEILVIDDGSKDRTAAEVEANFPNHPQVRLLRFENGGKAMALNRGLALAQGDIIVALDADTLFGRATIGKLARWFRDAKVGAVAGNALVGNQVNTVTRWQALEYVSAQNLERRALAALGTVTVVPGAVGAWRRQTLEALGGFPHDTLAEDQDLTLAAQSAGWVVEFDPEAVAFTEAPQTVKGLLKQRFRWSFGTLQCVWKHRRDLFNRKRPALGFVALPQIWLFQIILTVLAPLVDAAAIFSLISAGFDRLSHPVEWNSEGLTRALLYWTAFVLVDLAAAVIGMAMERRAPWGSLAWLPAQRFGYRQLMYYVVLKAVFSAMQGRRVEWGSLQRTATAVIDEGRPKPVAEPSRR